MVRYLSTGLMLVLQSFLLMASPLMAADQAAYENPESAASDPDFAVQGEYSGNGRGVQVVALGNRNFQVTLYLGGLPGAGWNGTDRNITEEDTDGVRKLISDLRLEKKDRQSPTLGARMPQGGVMLFDCTRQSLETNWQDGARITDDGLLMQGCTTRQSFRDFTIHVEFRLPYMPAARGQGRGNSGLYFQGRHEVQMLDSFGLEGKDNECGGLYSVKDPDLNMCLPPLAWQTYDADFTAARYDKDGKQISKARVTIRLNGVIVHREVELESPSTAAPNSTRTDTGPIFLQDHGNPVRYRNIWLVPRDRDRESRRPFIAGYERFLSSVDADPLLAGRLLVEELNCAACHAGAAGDDAGQNLRRAPVLDRVGQRVRPQYLLEFLQNPHGKKPGTLMPDLLARFDEDQRKQVAASLVSFLASTNRPADRRSDRQAAQRGENLFHSIGCVACHEPRRQRKVSPGSSVPLPDLSEKYTVASLAEFLKDPLAVHPAGRMPAFQLNDQEAIDLASYLASSPATGLMSPNLKFFAFEGSWNEIPDFDLLKPARTGESRGFDLGVAERTSNFGIRFIGVLHVPRTGDYQFHVGSDDGSRLTIDGQEVVSVDGIHPHQWNQKSVHLEQGAHQVRVEYMQGGGEWTLDVEWEGPGLPRHSVEKFCSLSPDVPPPPENSVQNNMHIDPALADRGREFFQTLGCANCHSLSNDSRLLESKPAKPWRELNPDGGCLSSKPGEYPQFDLSPPQTAAIRTYLGGNVLMKPLNPQNQIDRLMVAFNCYACHSRADRGGPERERNSLFVTTIQEMGDEGRVPPPLDGVGDKLTDEWLRQILEHGAKDRPYMLTRMPRFGFSNIGDVVQNFINADRKPSQKSVELPEPEHRARATGRHLAGEKGLSCIKCHNFGPHRGTGIQAINLAILSRRVRQDWFARYLPDPAVYRPGTRMPTGFPNGKSTAADVYEGDPQKQITALWSWITEGDRAGIPDGLVGNVIELKPTTEPIIYRNFLEGLSPRGIAVGYPQAAHFAWDAERMCLALIWHGRFIDASLHWEGRGAGNQSPLGDHRVAWETTAPLARLESPESEWPTSSARERGYTFRGYKLDDKRRPIFRYETSDFSAEELIVPVEHETADAALQRKFVIKQKARGSQVYFCLARGKSIEPQPNGGWLVNGIVRMQLKGDSQQPTLRKQGDIVELILPVAFENGAASIIQEIDW